MYSIFTEQPVDIQAAYAVRKFFDTLKTVELNSKPT